MPSYSRRIQIPGKSAQELYDAVSEDIEDFFSGGQFGKSSITRSPELKKVSFSISIKAASILADLTCLEAAISIDGKLSLLAAPFKSKIDEGIDHWLRKKFDLKS